MKTTFEAKDIRIEKVTHRKALIPNKDLVFGKYFTDHMFLVGWDVDKGWSRPRIKPYEKLTLEPSASVFHYGFEVTFKSSEKKALSRELLKCIALLLQLDELWIPKERGYSLYLRPTMIGTEPSLGVHAPNRVLLFVIASPVGPYYPSGFSAVSLLATQQYIRSWPNGMGDTKVGGNYAPCVKPQAMAHQHGHHQNLWLFGGQKELVTPPVSGLILPGVTRNSIIELVSSWGADMDIQVYEREITMDEVVIALQRGRVLEMFGSGTACIVTPIKRIGYAGHEFAVPLDPEDPSSEVGPLTKKLNENIMDIQYGVTPHRWSVNILDYE
ncbi:hypothetical protein DFQ29_008386 [Apophysomyces sp. BC1021]|nr:hypothetical protein DFQ29_008386 [Apophysomyces sp. BC1021]